MERSESLLAADENVDVMVLVRALIAIEDDFCVCFHIHYSCCGP